MLPRLALSTKRIELVLVGQVYQDNVTGWVSVFGSFAARYFSETALCDNTRNICHKQTPSWYDQKTVENDIKHQITHSFFWHYSLISWAKTSFTPVLLLLYSLLMIQFPMYVLTLFPRMQLALKVTEDTVMELTELKIQQFIKDL